VIEVDTPLVAQIERLLCEQKGVQFTGTYLHVSGTCNGSGSLWGERCASGASAWMSWASSGVSSTVIYSPG
jgi:hypothetical protein